MLKICICDDVVDERDKTRKALEIYSFQKETELLIDDVESPEALLPNYNAYDIIFMDIRFERVDKGIEAGIKLRKSGYKGILIFLTTYAKFAIQGYKAEPFRYIMKPVTENSLSEVMDEVIDKLNSSEDKLKIKVVKGFEIIDLGRLMYIEEVGRRRQLTLVDRTVQTLSTLKEIYELLPIDRFAQPQKGYIVSYAYVSKIQNRAIYMKDQLRISMGRGYKESFMLGLNKFLSKQ